MGRRGPAPKPTVLRLIEGNPGKRPINRNEPKPPPERPTCPRWLSPEAKREWRRVAPELEKLGLLTRVDRAALAAYCQAYARWRQAEEVLQREGLTFATESGYLMPRPEVKVAEKAMQIIRAFCIEFGLTPSARARMTVPEAKREEDPFEEFLSRGQAKGRPG